MGHTKAVLQVGHLGNDAVTVPKYIVEIWYSVLPRECPCKKISLWGLVLLLYLGWLELLLLLHLGRLKLLLLLHLRRLKLLLLQHLRRLKLLLLLHLRRIPLPGLRSWWFLAHGGHLWLLLSGRLPRVPSGAQIYLAYRKSGHGVPYQ
jgi:hypothetical protein